jgi:branched-chain amino acid aminotransferase
VIHRFVLHNQDIREAGELSLSPGQIGLLSGWGVFSTLRVAGGVPFAFERHWARIARDAARLHVAIPGDPQAVRGKLLELLEANQASDCTLRLVFVRNGGGIWEGPSNGRESDLIALTADIKDWGAGVKLAYQPNGRHAASPFAGAKILSWYEEAHDRGFDEVILLNERGEVSECTSANIFAAAGGEVWTPPIDSGCLPGITREVILEELRLPGVRVVEKTLFPADLEAAEEVFITSTTRDLLPVRQIEDRQMGRGDKTRVALQAAFSAFVDGYTAQHQRLQAAGR